MPESTSAEGGHTSSESRLLVPRSNAEVDVVSQPLVGVHVPVPKVGSGILGRLDSPWIYILQAIPRHLPSHGIYTVIAQPSQYTRALRQSPYAIILETRSEANHV